jgi:predicted DNA-binding transcriptional regulator AlpA
MDRMSHCHDRRSEANLYQASVSLRHLSQLELARRWSISPRTLERWRWTGDGPRYIKLKGRVAYREADVEAYEADRLMESTQQPVQAKLVQS